jgi:hypothetical protein
MLALVLVFCLVLVAAFTAVAGLTGSALVIAVACAVVLLNVLTMVLGANVKQRRPSRPARASLEIGMAERR